MAANITFRLVTGKVVNLELEPTQTILEVKIKLGTILQVQPQQIKLLFKTQNLADSKHISELPLPLSSPIQVLTIKTKDDSEIKEAPKQKRLSPFSTRAPRSESSVPEHTILPPRAGSYTNKKQSDPPHFKKSVRLLMEMGFPKEECEKALRASFYNSDRAAEYLIEGSIPVQCCSDICAIKKQRDEICGEFDSSVKQETELSMEKLSSEQKNSILKLEAMGYPRETVIQVYFACDKDETVAASCLSSLN